MKKKTKKKEAPASCTISAALNYAATSIVQG
jgi:hypothetical protein